MILNKALCIFWMLMFSMTIPLPLTHASEKEYPNRQIEFVICFPPGGPTDTATRIIQPPLQTALKVSIVLTNKSGAAGALATDFVAKAKPDGYTVLSAATTPLTIAPNVNPAITYKYADFTPICIYASDRVVIASKANAPWKTLDELVEYAKKNPGKLNYASPGMGTTPFFVFELFKLYHGLDIVPVHFQGTGPVKSAILGGHTDLAASGLGALIPLFRAGTIVPLVVTAPTRLPDFPNVPTMVEKKFPEASLSISNGLFVPQKCPRIIVEKLGREMEKIMKDPMVGNQLEGAELFVDYRDSEATMKMLELDFNAIARVAKKAGIRE